MNVPPKLRNVPRESGATLRGHLLGFLYSRVVRFEIVDGMSVALLPMQINPDLCISRGTKIPAEKMAALHDRFLLVQNGGLTTYVDAAGGSYMAVGVAKVGAR